MLNHSLCPQSPQQRRLVKMLFSANILRIHLVHYVTERAEIVLSIVAVDAIVYGYEADIVFGKVIVCVLTYLKVVSSETG